MGTSVLTPNNPDPLTGLRNSIIAWHFVGNAVADVLLGCNIIYVATERTWYPDIQPDKTNQSIPPLWQIWFTKGTNEPTIVSDTQWFGFDGKFIHVLDEADVNDNYTITAQQDPPIEEDTPPIEENQE